MSEIIDFKPRYNRAFNVEYVPVVDILNVPILIKDFVVTQFNDREIVEILVQLSDGSEVATRTSSRVIIKQLREYEKALKEGKKLRCKIVRRKRYYTLAPP